jgi:hypothetical protein
LKEKTGVVEGPEGKTELEGVGPLEGGDGFGVSGPVSGGGVAKVGPGTLLQV